VCQFTNVFKNKISRKNKKVNNVKTCYEYKYQLSLMKPRDALRHGKRAVNKDGR